MPAPTLTDLPEDLTGLTVEELAKVESDAVTAADAIIGKDPADLTDADEAELGRLGETVKSVRGETSRRGEAAEARAAKIADMRALIHAEDEVPVEGEGGETAEPEVEPEVEAPAEVEAPVEGDAGTGEAIAASGGSAAPSLARVAARTKPRGLPDHKDAVAKGYQGPKATLLASAGHETNVADIAKAAIKAAQSFPTGKRGGRQTVPLARIERPEIDGLTASGEMSESAIRSILDRAGDESRLPGGSLLASGGWCAPSETDYALAPGLESMDGMVSLPEISVTRGGINFTVGPDFSNLFGGAGFIHTEANDIAGDSKACFTVPCPSFTEVRLEAIGVCIIAGILGQKAYPENVERWITGTLAAHAHRVNGVTLDDMSDDSTVVSGMVVPGTGAASSQLSGLALQIADMRNRHRMGFGTTLEVVLPEWDRNLIRSDLAKFHSIAPDDAFKITNAQIDAWFASIGAAVQWVVDWQDNFSVDVVSGIGGPTPATSWPSTVKAMLYPAGTFVRGGGNIITIEALYDSTLLETNDYTALFTEDSHLTAKRGFESRLVTLQSCPTGEQAPTATEHACPTI